MSSDEGDNHIIPHVVHQQDVPATAQQFLTAKSLSSTLDQVANDLDPSDFPFAGGANRRESQALFPGGFVKVSATNSMSSIMDNTGVASQQTTRSARDSKRNSPTGKFAEALHTLAEVYTKDMDTVRAENTRLRNALQQLKGGTSNDDGSDGEMRQATLNDEQDRISGFNLSSKQSSFASSLCPAKMGPSASFKKHLGADNGEDVRRMSILSIMEDSEAGKVNAAWKRKHHSASIHNFKCRPAWAHVGLTKKPAGARASVRARALANATSSADRRAEISSSYSFFRLIVWHPGSYKRLCWDLVSMSLLAYDLVMIPFVGAFDPKQTDFLLVMTWITLLFWTLDIVASLLTGYQTDTLTVLHPRNIALHYAKTWLSVDLMIVCLDWAIVAIQGEMDSGGSAARLGRSLRTLRFVRTLRLIRLVKLKRIFQGIQDHLNTETLSICFGITKIILCLLMANHIVACGWYATGAVDGFSGANWVSANDMEHRDILYRYTTSLHWSLTQFTPASMEIYPHNVRERIFSVVVLLFAMLTFSSFVSILTASMAELRRIGNDESHKFWLLRRYLRDWHVSRGVKVRVIRFLEYAYQKQRQRVQEADVEILRLLSEPLREELGQELFSAYLSVHPLFRVCNKSIRHFSKALQTQAMARGDSVFACGEEASCITFASSGTLEYVLGYYMVDESQTGTTADNCSGEYVLEGQWVGEPVLWTPWVHLGDLQAITECQTMSVNAEQFAALVRTNKPLLIPVRKYAICFLAKLNKLTRDELTDLLHLKFSPEAIVESSDLKLSYYYTDGEDEDEDNIARKSYRCFQRFARRLHRLNKKEDRAGNFNLDGLEVVSG